MEIAVVGTGEFILGFRLAGVRKTYAAETDERLVEQINQVLQDTDVGILVLKGSDMERIPLRLRTTLENSVTPTVIRHRRKRGRPVDAREIQEIGWRV